MKPTPPIHSMHLDVVRVATWRQGNKPNTNLTDTMITMLKVHKAQRAWLQNNFSISVPVKEESHLCSKVFSHASLLNERSPSFLQASRVVREQSGRFNLRCYMGYLVLHSLQFKDCHDNPIKHTIRSTGASSTGNGNPFWNFTWKSKTRFPNWILCLV